MGFFDALRRVLTGMPRPAAPRQHRAIGTLSGGSLVTNTSAMLPRPAPTFMTGCNGTRS